MRIDLYLLNKIPGLTRSYAKKAILNGIVKLNGKQVRPNQYVKDGDSIDYDEKELKEFINSGERSEIKPVNIEFGIIYEDENILVIDKPSNLSSHPVPAHWEDTLLNGIVYWQRENNKLFKPRLVHRLDKDTSGVILVAKTKEAHEFYTKQFESYKAHKTYLAVVKGDFKKFLSQQGKTFITIENFLGRDTKDRKLIVSTNISNGQRAITDIYFEKYWENDLDEIYSLLKVKPKTGRTHQIRSHLKSINFPILGDVLYSETKFKRLMLHAYELEFEEALGNAPKSFKSDSPTEFK